MLGDEREEAFTPWGLEEGWVRGGRGGGRGEEAEGDGEGFDGGFDGVGLFFVQSEVFDELEDVGDFGGGAGADGGRHCEGWDDGMEVVGWWGAYVCRCGVLAWECLGRLW